MEPINDMEKLSRRQFPFIVMGISGDQSNHLKPSSENLSSHPKPHPPQLGNSKNYNFSNSHFNEKPKYPPQIPSHRNAGPETTGTVEASSPKTKQTKRRQHTRFTTPNVSDGVSLLEGISNVVTGGNDSIITSPHSQMKFVGREQRETHHNSGSLEDSAGEKLSSSSVLNPLKLIEKNDVANNSNGNSKNVKFSNLNQPQRDLNDYPDWTLHEKFDELFIKMDQKEDEIFCLRAEVSTLKDTILKNAMETGASKHLYQNIQKQLVTLEKKIENYQSDFVPTGFMPGAYDTPTPASSRGSVSDTSVAEFDYDKVIRAVKQLNMRVEQGQSMELCFTSGGASFKRWDGVNLTLYKNGLLLGADKDFMAFTSGRATVFVQDILDGFFPNELQCMYPQGVYFVIKDLRTSMYNGEISFFGEGHVLNNSPVREHLPKLVPGSHVTALKQRQFSVTFIQPSCNSSDRAFTLNRDSAGSTESATSRSSSSSLPEMDELPKLRAAYEILILNQSRGYDDKIISVKLKNIATGNCFKLKVSIFARVSEIVQHLNNQIELNPGEDLKLIHSLPVGILSVPSATLKDYGIEGNAVLYYRVDRM